MAVRVDLNISLDGFATTTDQTRENAFGPDWARLVWTNDEGESEQVTTVTLTESDGQTLVTVHDRYPSKQALDDEIASGSTGAMPEQLAQLDEFIASLEA